METDSTFSLSSELAISIVVPIFNAEKTLAACLESIRSQSFHNFECIMVDDGSTDRSAAICDEYACKDSRFISIHQQNCGGPGPVRIAGARRSRGCAIVFVDNDDRLEQGALCFMWEKRLAGAKYVTGGFRTLLGRTTQDYFTQSKLSYIENKDNCPLAVFFTGDAEARYNCHLRLNGCLIDRSLIEHIKAPTIKLYEDYFMIVQIMYQITWRDIAAVNAVLYNYTVYSQTSLNMKLMRQFSCGTFDDSYYNNSRLIYNFLIEHELDNNIIKAYICNTSFGLLHSFSIYMLLNKNKPARSEIAEFYRCYMRYHADWHPKLYLKYIIPLFYHFPVFSRFCRCILAGAGEFRLELQKAWRSIDLFDNHQNDIL